MTSDLDCLAKKAIAFAEEVVVRRNHSFIDNEFLNRCMFSNRYGTSFVTDKYKKLQAKWYESFSVDTCNIIPLEIKGKILTCAIQSECRHTGTFLNIKASGSPLTVKGTWDFMLTGNSISFLSSNVNVENILQQITMKNTIAPSLVAPIKSLPFRFFKGTLSYLEFIGVHISCRQLQTLSLWMCGYTDSEISEILKIEKCTVNGYQSDLKFIFNVRKKHILYQRLLEMDVIHLMHQCMFFMIESADTGNVIFTKKGLTDVNKHEC